MDKAYCSRCDRTFARERDLGQHRDDSFNHHECEKCSFDGTTWEKLLEHYRKTQHRVVCQGCDDGEGMTWVPGSKEYLVHLKEQNVCRTCEEHFQSASNLEHHKMVHLARSMECLCCNRKFATYPAMIIHLESGTCPSQVDCIDLNESAAICYQWRAYLNEYYRDDLLRRRNLQHKYGETVYPFKCPDCVTPFAKLSALFQHIYSSACGQTLSKSDIGELIRWLEVQHDVSESE